MGPHEQIGVVLRNLHRRQAVNYQAELDSARQPNLPTSNRRRGVSADSMLIFEGIRDRMPHSPSAHN